MLRLLTILCATAIATVLMAAPLVSAQGGRYGSLDFNTNPDGNFITITGCIPGLTVGTVDGSGNCTAVPEPATMMLLGTGLLAVFRARRRQA